MHSKQTYISLEILEKHHIKLPESNIQELKKTSTYIIAQWWQPPDIIIPSSKEKAIDLYNQQLAQKTTLQTLAYIDGSEINQEIGLIYVILEKRKAIKKFLEMNKTSTVYMGEMQRIQNLLIYALN